MLVRRADLAGDPWQERAARVLRSLHAQPARAAVCKLALTKEQTVALEIALEADYASDDPVVRAALLFVAGEFERYAELDFDGSLLRTFQETAPPDVRDRIANQARQHGQLSWTRVVLARPAAERSGGEWEATIALLAGAERWDDL